jgi:hypothetical protein
MAFVSNFTNNDTSVVTRFSRSHATRLRWLTGHLLATLAPFAVVPLALAAAETPAENDSANDDIQVIGQREGQSKSVLSQDASASPAAVNVLSATDIGKACFKLW